VNSLARAYRAFQKAGMQIFNCETVYEKVVRPGLDFIKRGMTANQEDA